MTTLYVHIPFCEKKCYYCSFVVAVAKGHLVAAYLEGLGHEASSYHGQRFASVYFGGGTPAYLSCDHLTTLIRMIRREFDFSREEEFTIEANPENIDEEKAERMLAMGINRVSLGAQSFDDRYLRFLGRCHDAETIYRAYSILRKAGFANINLDLMYSFPEQTSSEIEEDVKKLVSLGSEHVSLYALTLEEGSRFFARGISLQDNHVQARHYEAVAGLLEQAGFIQYEISNFCRPGKESRHNLNYWQGGEYIGLGVGAHSYLRGRRSWNVARLRDYLDRVQKGQSVTQAWEELPPSTRLAEALLFGLRMNRGVIVQELERRCHCVLEPDKRRRIDEFIANGLLCREDGALKATARGRLVLDDIAAYLI